jgi:hypothetical protein
MARAITTSGARPDGKLITVPVKIMPRHTANAILKAIGQRKKF